MNSQMIERTCCKLTLDDCLQLDRFAVLNVVPVPVVSKHSNDKCSHVVISRVQRIGLTLSHSLQSIVYSTFQSSSRL